MVIFCCHYCGTVVTMPSESHDYFVPLDEKPSCPCCLKYQMRKELYLDPGIEKDKDKSVDNV